MNENSSYANGGGYAGYSTMGVSSEQEGYNGGHLAGPYSPPITSNDSTPVIQDVREAVEDDDEDEDDDDEEEGEGVGYYDQERGNGKMSMSFRNKLRHEQYEDDEYDHKGLNYARSGSVSHEPPTYAKNEPTSPLLAATKEEDEEKENKNEKSLKSPDLSYLNNPSELPIKTNFSIIESKNN
ncbi:putative zinc finger protein [Candida maltosa Xu316]|uniref:Putative zinc finger protein n=1 Tax=Candida maltosa (strain Xu316) TaxID=1245528 RepID=M3JT90_CANMX|nr:putative zinc finger protein [Candida maltosa Xu316]